MVYKVHLPRTSELINVAINKLIITYNKFEGNPCDVTIDRKNE